MDGKQTNIPFGLLFEEAAPEPRGLIVPTYDEEADLSYVVDSAGHRIPYVEFTAAIGTETHTRIASESVDEDENRLGFLGTETATKVRIEATDRDPEGNKPRPIVSLGTESVTLIQSESTDTDPEDDRTSPSIRRPLVGTDTFTEVKREATDKD